MNRDTFNAAMSELEGAFGADKINDKYKGAVWSQFFRERDEVFSTAISTVMLECEYTPRIANIGRAVKEQDNLQSGGCPKHKIAEIQKVAENVGMCAGEAVQMIYWEYGWTWKEIPVSRVDEVKQYLIDNKDNKEIISILVGVESRKRSGITQDGYAEMTPFEVEMVKYCSGKRDGTVPAVHLPWAGNGGNHLDASSEPARVSDIIDGRP